MAPRDMVLVGAITGAHGIRGEVRLRSFTAEPAAIAGYSPLASATGAVIEITRLRQGKDGMIAGLRGIADRNAAEALKGVELFVPRARLPNPARGEAYVHDLIGLAVALPGGTVLGTIRDVANYGAGDLIDVERPGRADTVLIPFSGGYVLAVEADRVVVDLPEGFLDEADDGGDGDRS